MRYSVATWDCDLQRFTEQEGVACRHLTLGGLKRALQELRRYGYPARRGDHSVLVEQDYYPLVATEAGR